MIRKGLKDGDRGGQLPPAELEGRIVQAEEILRRFWGFEGFRTGQREAVEAAVAGRDVLAVLPTGGGKSICYQVPALGGSGLTLVISPLIALMEDQVAGLRARGVSAAFINSSLGYRSVEQRWLDAEFGKYRLLYVSPERLSSEEFVARAPRLKIERVAVDEAHCISEWGHHFRPEYRKIAEALEVIERPQVIALTATATPEVRRDILDQLKLRDPAVVVKGFDRPNIIWSIFHPHDRKRKIRRILEGVEGSGILYTATRRNAEEWAEWLERIGVTARYYHGGMPPDQRKVVQDAWLSSEVRMIAATSAFGMGIDKPDVRVVIHDGIPASVEAYYQEAGRAGRDGERAYGVLLTGDSDVETQQRLIATSHPDVEAVRKVHETVCSLAQVAVGSHPEDPLLIDVNDVVRVTGYAASLVRASVDLLERQGLWQRLPTSEDRGFITFPSGPNSLRAYAQRQSAALRSFVEAVVRTVDATAYSSWHPLDVRILQKNCGLGRQRMMSGLEFLQERSLLQWRSADATLVLELREPRHARVPVDVDGLRRSRAMSEAKLGRIRQYAASEECRRQFLLGYFGEWIEAPCGRCDVCIGRHDMPAVTPNDEREMRRLLSRIASMQPGNQARELELDEGEERLLAWLEREDLVVEDPTTPCGYTVTSKAARWLT